LGDGIDPLSIVLSNECDFENNKLSYIIVAALLPAEDIIRATQEFVDKQNTIKGNTLSKGQWSSLKKFIENFLYNKNISRYFFLLPGEGVMVPFLAIDFQRIQSIPYALCENLETVAKLNSPYKEQMIVHFSSYVSRIPVDREDLDDVIRKIISPMNAPE